MNIRFFLATYNNNVEIVKLLMEYANRNNIVLNINDKDKEYHHYPLYNAVAEGNNIEMVELLMNYANEKGIILAMGDNIAGKNPLSWAIAQNNFEIVKLILDYTNEKGIKLILNEIILESTMKEYHEEIKNVVSDISEIKSEIISLLDDNCRNKNLYLIFNMNNSYRSPLLNRMEEISQKKK